MARTELPLGVWVSDPRRSSIAFSLKQLPSSTFSGRFDGFRATLTVTPDRPAALVMEAAAAPLVRLEADVVPRSCDDIEIDGVLHIRGQALVVAAGGTLSGEDVLALRAGMVVDRRQLGLEWNVRLPDGTLLLEHELTLEADLQFVPADPHQPEGTP